MDKAQQDALVERLREVDGTPVDSLSLKWLRNPEGPQAADRIQSLQADNERLRRLASNLETACDKRACETPRHVYLAMVDAGMGDVLEALDEARRAVRQALATKDKVSDEGAVAGGAGWSGSRLPLQPSA